MFCTIIWSKIEANSKSEVEVESAHKPRGPSDQHLSCWVSVCSIKWLRVFLLTPSLPGWDAIPSPGYPAIWSLPVPTTNVFIHLSGKRHCVSVLPKNTIQCSQPGLEARLIKTEKKYKNQITGCLHRQLTNYKMDSNYFWLEYIVNILTCTWCSVEE